MLMTGKALKVAMRFLLPFLQSVKRDALRRDELVKAIMKSDKTYDEVLEFLKSGKSDEKLEWEKAIPG